MMNSKTNSASERLSPADGSGKLVDVETELRRMAGVLGTTTEGRVCELAAEIVLWSGRTENRLKMLRDQMNAFTNEDNGDRSEWSIYNRGRAEGLQIALHKLSQNSELNDRAAVRSSDS